MLPDHSVPGGRWALVVGVDNYPPAFGFAPLPQGGNDARVMAEGLSNLTPPLQVRVLSTGAGAQNLPTLANIRTEIQRLANYSRSGDLVVLYFSGHGVFHHGSPALVPLDGRRDHLEETTLSLAWIQATLADLEASVVLVILDMCHAAPPGKGLERVLSELGQDLHLPSTGHLIMAASRHDESAHVDEVSGLSIFTHFLVSGLRGTASDETGVITVGRLYQRVCDGVRQWTYTQGHTPQTPVLLGRQEGDVPLGRPNLWTPTFSLHPREATLIGRRDELKLLERKVNDHQLVTLKGPGGVGKTSVARALCARITGQGHRVAVWLPLDDLTPVSNLTQEVANRLRITLDARTPELSLIRWLQPRELMLVLDNVEQVITPVSRMVEGWIHHCPHLRILATSRTSLALDGECVFELQPLSLPPVGGDLSHLLASGCGELFLTRAQQVLPNFSPTQHHVATLITLCRGLDGLPLAIELAVLRLKLLQPHEILERLEQQLQLLKDPRSQDPRHASLRATLEWSWALLTPAEQALLRRMSVFAGGATLAAMEQVVVGTKLSPEELLDSLTGLVAHSLVVVDFSIRHTRYRLMSVIREFASEKLADAAEVSHFQARHTAWCSSYIHTQWYQDRKDPDDLTPFEGLDEESANIEHMLDRLDTQEGAPQLAQVICHLVRYWLRRGRYGEPARWSDRLLTYGSAVSNLDLRLEVMLAGANGYTFIGKAAKSLVLLNEIERLCHISERPHTRMVAAVCRSFSLSHLGEHQEALLLAEEAYGYFENSGDLKWQGTATTAWAMAARALGRLPEVETAFRLEMARLHHSGAKEGMLTGVHLCLADTLMSQGRYDEARPELEKAVSASIGTPFALYSSVLSLRLARRLGDLPTARLHCLQALPLAKRVQDMQQQLTCLVECTCLLAQGGHLAEAAEVLVLLDRVSRDLGVRYHHVDVQDQEVLDSLRSRLHQVVPNPDDLLIPEDYVSRAYKLLISTNIPPEGAGQGPSRHPTTG